VGGFGSWIRRIEGRETAEPKAREVDARDVAVRVDGAEAGQNDGHNDVPPRGYRERLSRPTRKVEPLATGREVADLLRVHPKTVERWRKESGLPCLRVGGSIRFVVSDVFSWASARKEA
jgi:excisionase family DNA binding protein